MVVSCVGAPRCRACATKAVAKQLREEDAKKWTLKKVANAFGVDESTASRWMPTTNLQSQDGSKRTPDARWKVNPAKKPEIAAAVKAGKPQAQVAAAEAKERQKESGKHHGRGQNKLPPKTAEPISKGDARDVAAKKYGVGHTTVKKTLPPKVAQVILAAPATQRAMVALEVEKHLAKEAKERKTATLKRGDKKAAPVSQKVEQRGKAAEKAAALTKTNRQYVSDAKKSCGGQLRVQFGATVCNSPRCVAIGPARLFCAPSSSPTVGNRMRRNAATAREGACSVFWSMSAPTLQRRSYCVGAPRCRSWAGDT